MLMALLMFVCWQSTNNSQYQGAFQKSTEAAYAGSDLKANVDKVQDHMREKYPLLSTVGPAGYALGVKKQAQITTSKVSPIPNTVTTYKFDEKTNTGTVTFTWRF